MHHTASSRSKLPFSCIILFVTDNLRAGVVTHHQGHSSILISAGDGHTTRTVLELQIQFVGAYGEGKARDVLFVYTRSLSH